MSSLSQMQTPETPQERRDRRKRAREQYLHAVASSSPPSPQASDVSPRSAFGGENQAISPKRPRASEREIEEEEAAARRVKLDSQDKAHSYQPSLCEWSSGLLRLPIEVRYLIYEYAVTPRVHLIVRNARNHQTPSQMLEEAGLGQGSKPIEEAARHSLKLINRQLYKEVCDYEFREIRLAINLEPWLTELLLMKNVSVADWDFRETYLGWLGSHRNISFRVKIDHFELLSPLVLLLHRLPMWGTPIYWTIYLEMGKDIPVKSPQQLSLMHSLARFTQIEHLKISLHVISPLQDASYSAILLHRQQDATEMRPPIYVNNEAAKEIEDFSMEHSLEFSHTPALNPTNWISPSVSRLVPPGSG